MELVSIGVAALLTSVLSAVAGLGGGVILLAVILQFFAPTTAIPIHGGIQLVSNGSRAQILRRDIEWRVVGWSIILLLPASLVGVAVGAAIPERVLTFVIAGFVLIVAWRPTLLKWRGSESIPAGALVGVGAVSGFLSATVGASGPVTSPFYKAATASHKAFVATAAAAQVFAHSSKLLAFSLDEFDPFSHLDVMLVGAIGVSAGSWIGTRLLGSMAPQHLDLVFKIVLSILALRLLFEVATG